MKPLTLLELGVEIPEKKLGREPETREYSQALGFNCAHDLFTALDLRGAIRERILQMKIIIRPGHGPCCTCQKCGQFHDDCKCEYNRIIEDIAERIAPSEANKKG